MIRVLIAAALLVWGITVVAAGQILLGGLLVALALVVIVARVERS